MKVSFIRVKKPEKARHLCELAEKYLTLGRRVYMTVSDENQAVTLDRFMWSWKQASFLPHVYDNGAVDCHQEPIVIGTRERNPNAASVLIMGQPCSLEFMQNFEMVVDFAELYDPELAELSRVRFKQYRKAGFDPGMSE